MTCETERTNGAAQVAAARPRILPRQRVAMRDGVGLCTDVYLPQGAGPAPSVLIRTPYGRHLPFLLILAKKLNELGLAAVLQDSRGRYQSEGVASWELETDDGFDTLAWVGRQPWCAGPVGLLGMSITSLSNFRLAAEEAPEGVRVDALLSIMGAIDFHSMFYDSGAVNLHWALPWCHLMGTREVGRNTWRALPWSERFGHLPLATVPDGDAFDLSLWRFVLSHPERGGFWDEFDSTKWLEGLATPTLFLSGWYDFMLKHSLSGFEELSRRGRPSANSHKLVVGPWNHSSIFRSFNVAASPSRAAETSAPDLMGLVLGWFETWLAPRPAATPETGDLTDQRGALLYVLHADRWVAADSFPLREATDVDWYLAAGEEAEDSRRGVLLREPAAEPGCLAFEYDPENPQPTQGGAIWPLPDAGLLPGPTVQSDSELRQDFLRYDSEPLEDDLIVVGRLRVSLWASTSVRDTDFTAKLIDVDAGGLARIIQDGIRRGRFHRDLAAQTLLEPHRPCRFEIDLVGTAHCFRRGHRLRLEISSSNFPKYDRSLNSGAPLHSAARGTVAYQTVFHGGEMASRIRLPVLPKAMLAKLGFDPLATWGRGHRSSPES